MAKAAFQKGGMTTRAFYEHEDSRPGSSADEGLKFSEYFAGVFTNAHGFVSDPRWSGARLKLASIMNSLACEIVMTAVMFVNLVIVVLVVDTEASGEEVPLWMRGCMTALVLAYCIEVSARIYVLRWKFFLSAVHVVDVVVVAADLVSCAFQIFLADRIAPDFTPLRIIRVIRLLRSAKILVLFRSLYLLVNGMASAMRAVMWALIMISFALILCSIFAVVVIQPYVDEIVATSDVFDGCPRCAIAYSSVWHAYMTFFQSIIAGDSWGAVTLPIMDAHPWTALFFVPVLLLIQLGLINMILAVIVDKAQDAREDDQLLRMEMKQQKLKQAQKDLLQMCTAMDADSNGELTLEEMLWGYNNNDDFAEALQVMDIGQEDLAVVFNILDKDKSGACTYAEFVESLWKVKSQDSHTLLVFIKAYITDVKNHVEETLAFLKSDIASKLAETHPQELQADVGAHAGLPHTGCTSAHEESEGSVGQLNLKPCDVPACDGQQANHSNDLNLDMEVSALIKDMSEKIEAKLDTLARVLPTPPAGVDSATFPPLLANTWPLHAQTEQQAHSLPTFGTDDWQTQAPTQQLQRRLPAAFCLASESDIVSMAPRKTMIS